MAAEREPDDLRWFCPQCGFFEWPALTAEDEIAGVKQGPIIDEDGCCAGCGCTCARMGEIRALLAKHGLHLVTDADLRVLDIMSTLKIKMCVGEWMISDARELDLCKAELARRGEKP